MSYEDKPGDGVLFKNKDKEAGDKRPDYKGTWTNGSGEKCNIAAWIRESKNGTKFMSLKMDMEPWNQERPSEPESQDNGPDDDVPF